MSSPFQNILVSSRQGCYLLPASRRSRVAFVCASVEKRCLLPSHARPLDDTTASSSNGEEGLEAIECSWEVECVMGEVKILCTVLASAGMGYNGACQF